jgi:hypothetical protein
MNTALAIAAPRNVYTATSVTEGTILAPSLRVWLWSIAWAGSSDGHSFRVTWIGAVSERSRLISPGSTE